MNNIYLDDYKLLRERKTTLKSTSKDSSTNPVEYMTESQHPAVNFDKVMKDYSNTINGYLSQYRSVDALTELASDLVFIEFKNGKINSDTIDEIKEKINDSMLVCTDITKTRISDMRELGVFILVYNHNKNHELSSVDSRRDIAIRLKKMGGEIFDLGGLRRYEGFCFREVHTYTKEEFEDYLVGKTIA